MSDERNMGEKCQQCGKRYLTVYRVPDDVWARIRPKQTSPSAGLLCLECADFLARLLRLDIYWEAAQHNFPSAALAQARREGVEMFLHDFRNRVHGSRIGAPAIAAAEEIAARLLAEEESCGT